MSNNSKNFKFKDTGNNRNTGNYTGKGNLPQYGKKGHKPRSSVPARTISMDDIQTNDISYWNKTSGFDNVTKFNWDLILGRPRNPNLLFKHDSASDPVNFTNNLNPTAIMAIRFVLGCGWAESVEDGVNRGLAKIMSSIRASLSTSNIGFETADLGIFLTSTSSIAAFIGYAKRILESYTVWKDRNYMYPRALIKIQGPDYSDIRDNINTYAARLNAIIDQYNAMSILDTFDVFDRQYSMCHNIFADEDSEFGQLYLFVPDNYYVYNDTAIPSKAEFKSYTAAGKTFPQILSVIQEMIDAWYGSSDLYQINGTLLRAFKDAPRQAIPYYELSDQINPTVDRAFLMQIMNCTMIDGVNAGTLDITQEPTAQNYVIWKPVATGQNILNPLYADFQMLRLFEDDISQDDCMELTRLMNFADPDTHELTYCGSELVTKITLWRYDTTTDTLDGYTLGKNAISFERSGTSIPDIVGSFGQISAIAPFRYIPTVHVVSYHDMDPDHVYYGLLGDLYNWMFYSRDDWHTLQFVAYQSLWTPKNM